MIRFLRKLYESFRMFFVILFEKDKGETRTQTLVEEKREIAKPVELGISNSDKPEYLKSKSVLTKPERILLRAICRVAAEDYTILMKVRMGDFIWLANEPQDRKFHNNQVQCKHVDFLLCNKESIEPLLVIELDDRSHKNYDHTERDKFKDETFDAVGIPYIRIQIQDQYDAESLKKQIREKIGDRPLFTPGTK